MTITKAAAVAALLACSTLAGAAGAPDFSGHWELNNAKGKNLGMMAAVQQTVSSPRRRPR